MRIVPAVLAERWEDFTTRLREAESFARYIQIDVMDGHFVPTKSFPMEMLNDVVTELSVEVHLMVDGPIDQMAHLRNPAVKKVIFHVEASTDPLDVIHHIEQRGLEAAIAFRPETIFEDVIEIVETVNHLLFLTVDPGRYGSPFKPEVLEKVAAARYAFPDKAISVDGGISLENLKEIYQAGADCAIVGSRIFLAGDPAATYRLFLDEAGRIEGREARP